MAVANIGSILFFLDDDGAVWSLIVPIDPPEKKTSIAGWVSKSVGSGLLRALDQGTGADGKQLNGTDRHRTVARRKRLNSTQ